MKHQKIKNETRIEHWLKEAKSRAKEIDEGLVTLVPGSKVIKKARALTK